MKRLPPLTDKEKEILHDVSIEHMTPAEVAQRFPDEPVDMQQYAKDIFTNHKH